MTSSTGAPSVRATARRPGSGMAALAVLMVLVGSFLPWVHTPVGNPSGVLGAGLWTMYAAFLGLAGVFMPWHRIAAGHVAVFAAVAVALPVWQVVHVWSLVGFGGWIPGTGAVLTACGGAVAGVCASRLWRGA